MRKRRKSSPLKVHDKTVQRISNQFNLEPKAVAYIRAAILEGGYTKESLIDHIYHENKRRYEAIESYKNNGVYTDEQKQDLIMRTQVNLDFREGIKQFLHDCDRDKLESLLQDGK